MIQITIYKKPENQYKGFQVIGHADSVEEGADLVCCSVSVLTINLVNSLDMFTDDEFEVTEQEELGLVQVTFKNPLSDKALLLMAESLLTTNSSGETENQEVYLVPHKKNVLPLYVRLAKRP